MSERRTSAEIEAELESTRNDAARLQQKINDCEAELVRMKEQLRDLEGGYRSGGKIGELTEELKRTKTVEDDAGRIAVVWKGEELFDSVVDKVTKKLIYVRKRGDVHDDFFARTQKFNLDGTANPSWREGAIDIRQTFSIDSDTVPPNWKPTAAVTA